MRKIDREKNGIHTPKAIACAIPNFGTFLAHRGLKWSVRQILPPRYILAVLPSNSGSAISGAVAGYVIGICEINVSHQMSHLSQNNNSFQFMKIQSQTKLTSNSTLNSYFSRLCIHQQVPNHFVPSLFDSNRNQSVPESLLFWTYCGVHLWNLNTFQSIELQRWTLP